MNATDVSNEYGAISDKYNEINNECKMIAINVIKLWIKINWLAIHTVLLVM